MQAIGAWDGVRVDVLNDSGPPMGPELLPPWLKQRLADHQVARLGDVGGGGLRDWIEDFLDPDSDWESVIPASLQQ